MGRYPIPRPSPHSWTSPASSVDWSSSPSSRRRSACSRPGGCRSSSRSGWRSCCHVSIATGETGTGGPGGPMSTSGRPAEAGRCRCGGASPVTPVPAGALLSSVRVQGLAAASLRAVSSRGSVFVPGRVSSSELSRVRLPTYRVCAGRRSDGLRRHGPGVSPLRAGRRWRRPSSTCPGWRRPRPGARGRPSC